MKSHALTSILAVLAVAAAPSLVTAQTNIFPASGNVGIGTTSPGHKLDVVGNINISAGSTYKYNGANVISALTTLNDYFFGSNAGNLTMTGTSNTATGCMALSLNVSGNSNTANGTSALSNNSTGAGNTAVGYASLYPNTTGSYNAALGYNAGRFISDGSTPNQTSGQSVYLGATARANASGDTNEIVIGYNSVGLGNNTAVLGNSSTVTTAFFGNVGIGTTTPQQKLHVSGTGRFGTDTNGYVEIRSTASEGGTINLRGSNGTNMYLEGFNGFFRLVNSAWTEELFHVDQDGNTYVAGYVGIGTASPTYPLTVNGTVRAKEVIVDTGWSDFVFAPDHRLAPLTEVEAAIKADRHLPGIPSQDEVAAKGVSVGEMQAKLLEKVEELTLYVIAQDKRIQKLEEENLSLRAAR